MHIFCWSIVSNWINHRNTFLPQTAASNLFDDLGLDAVFRRVASIWVVVHHKGWGHNPAAGVALGFLVVASKLPAKQQIVRSGPQDIAITCRNSSIINIFIINHLVHQCQVQSLTCFVQVHRKGTRRFSCLHELQLCVSPGDVDHRSPLRTMLVVIYIQERSLT